MKTTFFTKSPAPTPLHITSEIPFKTNPADLSAPESLGQLPVDVLENKNEIRIIAPLAGVNVEEVEIFINNDVLTIKGKREMEPETAGLKNAEFFARECYWGPFSRSVILPVHADIGGIEATQKNHILYIRIPKKPSVQMRIVRIQSK